MRSRQKIIDATVELVETSGFESVSIAAVAHAANVSRQTVYSIFGSREDMVSQAIAGLVIEAFSEIHTRLHLTQTPFDYVTELIVAGRAVVRTHPILVTLLQAGPGNPLFDEGMIARAKPIVQGNLAPLAQRYPALAPSIDELGEITLRLGMSVILFDDESIHSDAGLRRFLRRWLLPAMPSIDDDNAHPKT